MGNVILKYYYDVTRYNLAFSILIGLLRGVVPGVVSIGTFGMIVGLICFRYYQKNQYYFYYNLGFTRLRLIATTWALNLIITLLLLLLFGNV